MRQAISYFINVRMGDKKFRIILFFIAFFIFSVLLFFHLHVTANQNFFPEIIGSRNKSLLDLWSIQHFFSGIVIGSLLIYFGVYHQANYFNFMLFLFFLALTWEVVELALEINIFERIVIDWRGDHEHWSNRFLSDPLLLLIGGDLACRYPKLWKISLVLIIILGIYLSFS